MEDSWIGMKIEGFAVGALRRTFGGEIDRHHPYLSWATATVSGSASAFSETKDKVLLALKGVQDVLYHEGGHDDLLNDLAAFESAVENSCSPGDIGNAIEEHGSVIGVALGWVS